MLSRKSILDVTFPIFKITKTYKRIWTEDKITYIETPSGVFVLDNKNIEGDTLARRRLRINNMPLYRPRGTLLTIAQLIKSGHKIFIDSDGEVFKYIKTQVVKLKYYKVSKRIPDNLYHILVLKDIDYQIRLPTRDSYGVNYVGLLDTPIGYIEYDFSEEPKADSWRKI